MNLELNLRPSVHFRSEAGASTAQVAAAVASRAIDKSCRESVLQSSLVFVIDSDPATRAMVEAVLSEAGWRTETFACAQVFLDRPRHGGPSCVVLDLHVPRLGGLELQRAIAAERADMPIIFMTGQADVPVAVQAMKAGAADFLMKPVRSDVLLRVVDEAIARSRAVRERTMELHGIASRYASLTLREQQVMRLVVQGLLNKQVGGELGISEITVKAHRGRVMQKMQARSLPHLVGLALELDE